MDDDIKKLKPVRLKVVQVKRDAVGNCWRALDDPVQVSLFWSPVIVRFFWLSGHVNPAVWLQPPQSLRAGSGGA